MRGKYCYRFYEREIVTTIAIVIVGRAITIKRQIKERSKEILVKNQENKIKSDNFTRSNIEKSNIAN